MLDHLAIGGARRLETASAITAAATYPQITIVPATEAARRRLIREDSKVVVVVLFVQGRRAHHPRIRR